MNVKQIIKRCNMGGNVSDIETLLTEQPLTDYPLKYYGNVAPAGDSDLSVPFGSTWVNTLTYDGATKGLRRESLTLWMHEQAFKGSLHDLMVYFWQNHFGVDYDTVIEPNFCWQYYMVLRSNAMGNFKKFIKDITLNSAMLVRLNGEVNSKVAPNKNYARELLELFTLKEGNYTEEDVNMVAKCMSGMWHDYNSISTSKIYLDPNNHDMTDKQFSSFFNNVIIKGSSVTWVEVDAVIDMIFGQQPNTVAKHICTKLYRFFIDSDVNEAFVQEMANVFISSNWEIKPVLRFILNSAHFNDTNFAGSIIKSPIELVANFMRDFKLKCPTDVDTRYRTLYKVRIRLLELQNYGNPPSIAGWVAYRQSPEWDDLWYTSSTAQLRDMLIMDLFDQSKFTYNGGGFWVDCVAFTQTLSNPADPNTLINEVMDTILPLPVSQEEKNRVKTETLLSGQADDRYWTNAWNRYVATPDPTNRAIVNDRLLRLYKYVVSTEQYQQK